jgi:hypothetical protein
VDLLDDLYLTVASFGAILDFVAFGQQPTVRRSIAIRRIVRAAHADIDLTAKHVGAGAEPLSWLFVYWQDFERLSCVGAIRGAGDDC